MRQKFVCGNWKMHGTLEETRSLIQGILSQWETEYAAVEVAICPPYTVLMEAQRLLQGSPIQLGAQNAHHESRGAYTGEVSLVMLADLGVSYVIIGHSERRAIFKETDAFINQKLQAAIEVGLRPILCIGETLDEREKNVTEKVLAKQLEESLENISSDQLSKVTIAYEPVWAIGTGKTATPTQAQDAHGFIRQKLAEMYDPASAEKSRIQYGGSVKPENALELFSLPDVDGGLIGGAALSAKSFMAIVEAASKVPVLH
jgi:triosephosphate isomerase